MTSFEMWTDLLDESIPLLFLVALGLAFYRGYRKNHTILSEREDLLKRYLLFRGDKQVRLKLFAEDEKAYQELLKTISSSWKNFKRSYDEHLSSLTQNTARTRVLLKVTTLGLVVNSLRLLTADFLFFGLKFHLFYTVVRELSSYILVILSFSLLRMQTHRFLHPKGKVIEIDREILFFPNSASGGEKQGLYNEFDPLDVAGADDGEED
jgi:hypothetical protein